MGETAGHLDRTFKPKMFATGTDCFPIYFYKTYLSHRLASANKHDCSFYLGIKYNRSSDNTVWYIDYAMGKNKLGTLMKMASNVSGLIQRFVDSKFTPNEVAQLRGHKNLKSLDLCVYHLEYSKAVSKIQNYYICDIA